MRPNAALFHKRPLSPSRAATPDRAPHETSRFIHERRPDSNAAIKE